jgi:alpha-beta hydrolase superfamily lysophospholipase
LEQSYIVGTNGKSKIACYYWTPDVKPRGIVYFAHGVTEYALRHKHFIDVLVNNSFAVCANDHMGHGDSKNDHPMYFAGADGMSGWQCACEDACKCIAEAKKRFGENIPVYGIGFSLGSFIVRTLAIQYPHLFSTMVLIGTGDQPKIKTMLGKIVAKNEMKKHGAQNQTQMIDNLTFDEYNKKFEGETRVDWLCVNKTARQNYLEDERCTAGFSSGLFYDLLCGMEQTGNKNNIALMSKDVPIMLISGENDAVGDYTKGVERLKEKYEKAGIKATTCFMTNMRHDVLHEESCSRIHSMILNFLFHN